MKLTSQQETRGIYYTREKC